VGNSKEKIPLQRVDPFRWRIPASYNDAMHVPGIVYADDELIQQILDDNALHQVANVATLPGIVGHSLGMPDIHWGYVSRLEELRRPMRKPVWFRRAVSVLTSIVACA